MKNLVLALVLFIVSLPGSTKAQHVVPLINDSRQYSFAELDRLYKKASPLANDVEGLPLDNKDNYIFINDKYLLIMLQTYHRPIHGLTEQNIMPEHYTWNVTMNGQIVDIPNRLSYQSIELPKLIGSDIVFRAVNRLSNKYFYTVISDDGKKVYYLNRY